MKHLRVALVVVALLAHFRNLYGQGFVDLDFEAATIVPESPPLVEFAQAFPGWSESPGAYTTSAVYDTIPLDSTAICIIDDNSPFASSFGGVIEGYYSAILAAGLGSSGAPTDAILSQTGMVPVGTESLQFKADEHFDSSGAFTVTLDDQALSLMVLGTGPNYTLYGANVSQWAGETANLAFTVVAENPHVSDEFLTLDAIQFSSQQVPEPDPVILFAISVLFLCWRMKWPIPTPEPPAVHAGGSATRSRQNISVG